MAFTMKSVSFKLGTDNTTTYTADIVKLADDSYAAYAVVPLATKGQTIKADSLSCTAVTGEAGVTPYTYSSYTSLAVPNKATITVTDSTDTTAQTFQFVLDLNFPATSAINTINRVGWFNFRNIKFTTTYATGGITIPGGKVAEVIGIQCADAVAYEFKNNKLVLYSAASTEYTNGADVDIAVLAVLE